MTEAEARDKTKWFGEGVSVRIWCYAGAGDWLLCVDRYEPIRFYGIDALKRRLVQLHGDIRKGRNIQLIGDGTEPNAVTFVDVADAYNCLSEIDRARRYLETLGDPDWISVPDEVFNVQPLDMPEGVVLAPRRYVGVVEGDCLLNGKLVTVDGE